MDSVNRSNRFENRSNEFCLLLSSVYTLRYDYLPEEVFNKSCSVVVGLNYFAFIFNMSL